MPRSWTRGTKRAVGLRITAPLLLAVGLLMAGCSSGTTGLGLNLVSPQEAAQMGVQSWEKLRSEIPPSDNAAYQQRARQVAGRLLTAIGENPSAWEVVVFKDPQINAFALPGKKIGVYEGMMKMASTDAQLAAVLGHEIAHVEKGHTAQRLSTAMVTQTGIELGSVALGGLAGISPDQLSALLGLGAQYGVILPFSRNQESEADRTGLQYMAEAGYNPEEAVALWEKMRQIPGQPPAFLSDHPATDERIKELQALMPEAMQTYRAHGGR